MTLQPSHPEFHLDDAFSVDTVDLVDTVVQIDTVDRVDVEVAIALNEINVEEAAVEDRDNKKLSVAVAQQKADQHSEYHQLM